LARPDGKAIASLAARAALDLGAVKDGWNGYSVLHAAASRVGGLDIGLVPGAGGISAQEMAAYGTLDVLFLLGADEIDVARGAFVVYIGTHGDRGAHRADVILPGAAYTEKTGLAVNTEGRVQLLNRAGFPPGDAREDWAILRALSDRLGCRLPYDSLAQLRATLFKAHRSLRGSTRLRRPIPPICAGLRSSAALLTMRPSIRRSKTTMRPIRSRARRP
jgi:NADH dehydrogenase/NADH:ubiquinone oxidoreductase 75 kD subunit (chain G)